MPRTRRSDSRMVRRQEWKKYHKNARRYRDLRKNNNRPVKLAFPGYNFIPTRAVTQLRLCDEGIIGASSNYYIHDIIYRANSIWDSLVQVGVGGQPMGRDQLALLYNKYKVHSCKIKLTVTSNTGTPMRFGIVPNNSTTSFTDILDACEQPSSKFKALSTYSGGLSSNSVKQNLMTKVVLGQKELDDEESALMTDNPENEWYYHVVFSTQPYTGTNYIDCAYYVEIIYNVEAFDRIVLARS